jgi:hypothetical protein
LLLTSTPYIICGSVLDVIIFVKFMGKHHVSVEEETASLLRKNHMQCRVVFLAFFHILI